MDPWDILAYSTVELVDIQSVDIQSVNIKNESLEMSSNWMLTVVYLHPLPRIKLEAIK